MAYNKSGVYEAPSTVQAVAVAVVNRNKDAATAAAYLEAGRIATSQVSKLAAKHLPMMVRGYADTPAGRIVLANLAQAAFAQFRPQEPKLVKLGNAMNASAYQELLQTFNVEGFIDDLLGNASVKGALDRLPD